MKFATSASVTAVAAMGLAVMGLALSPPALAQQQQEPELQAPLPSPDPTGQQAAQPQASGLDTTDFIRQAVQDNIADVEAGRIAQSSQTAPQSVQELGRRITQDSIQWNGELAKLAQANNVPITNQLVPQDRQALDQLSQMQGDAFTREYLRYVISDLEQDVRMYQQAAQSAQDQQVQQFAQATLPKLQEHLTTARTVYDAQVAATPGTEIGEPAQIQPGQVEPGQQPGQGQ